VGFAVLELEEVGVEVALEYGDTDRWIEFGNAYNIFL
jgi:hypothetical protein